MLTIRFSGMDVSDTNGTVVVVCDGTVFVFVVVISLISLDGLFLAGVSFILFQIRRLLDFKARKLLVIYFFKFVHGRLFLRLFLVSVIK